MKIYTKTGDEGLTGLIGGTRVSKNDIRIEAYGTVDELNSYIGWLLTYSLSEKEIVFLQLIQNDLFIIGSNLATDTTKTNYNFASILNSSNIEKIEAEIDRLYVNLPPLNNFILPGGSQSASICHICRTISRRCERRILEMNTLYSVDNNIITYINRLSDYFFALSRNLNINNGGKEIFWKGAKD